MLGRGLAGKGRAEPDCFRTERGDTTAGIDFALEGELDDGDAREALTGVIALALSETVDDGVARDVFAGVGGLILSAASTDDLAEVGVVGLSDPEAESEP